MEVKVWECLGTGTAAHVGWMDCRDGVKGLVTQVGRLKEAVDLVNRNAVCRRPAQRARLDSSSVRPIHNCPAAT